VDPLLPVRKRPANPTWVGLGLYGTGRSQSRELFKRLRVRKFLEELAQILVGLLSVGLGGLDDAEERRAFLGHPAGCTRGASSTRHAELSIMLDSAQFLPSTNGRIAPSHALVSGVITG
jgi:hypothetical protein